MSAALDIIVVTIAAVLCLGLLARRGKDMNLEQWSVGGRGFGTILVFVAPEDAAATMLAGPGGADLICMQFPKRAGQQ